jgi:hypothetical protein
MGGADDVLEGIAAAGVARAGNGLLPSCLLRRRARAQHDHVAWCALRRTTCTVGARFERPTHPGRSALQDDVFEAKEEIASNIKDELTKCR